MSDTRNALNIANGTNPVGTIISYLGNDAPQGYLKCDGEVYAITLYPFLAQHFEQEFGVSNYFGGDGEATFAVPDLRGEFLRCTGTATRATGSGADVGTHQNPTRHMRTWNGSGSHVSPYEYSTGIDSDLFGPDVQSGTYGNWLNKNYGRYPQYYTSRPTCTSVWYCIKY